MSINKFILYYLHVHFLLKTLWTGVVWSTMAISTRWIVTVWRKRCIVTVKVCWILHHWRAIFTSLKHISSGWWWVWKTSTCWYHICCGRGSHSIRKGILNICHWKWGRCKIYWTWSWAKIVGVYTIGKTGSSRAVYTCNRGAILPIFPIVLEFNLRIELIIGRSYGQRWTCAGWIRWAYVFVPRVWILMTLNIMQWILI